MSVSVIRSRKRTVEGWAHSLRNHCLVIVLQTVGDSEDWHQAPINLLSNFHLFLRVPGLISLVSGQHLHSLVIVDGVDLILVGQTPMANIFIRRCVSRFGDVLRLLGMRNIHDEIQRNTLCVECLGLALRGSEHQN